MTFEKNRGLGEIAVDTYGSYEINTSSVVSDGKQTVVSSVSAVFGFSWFCYELCMGTAWTILHNIHFYPWALYLNTFNSGFMNKCISKKSYISICVVDKASKQLFKTKVILQCSIHLYDYICQRVCYKMLTI